ncbi:MAG: fibrobacter succinogenes major paralogous domain-containing protein [Chitinophagales bacterium]
MKNIIFIFYIISLLYSNTLFAQIVQNDTSICAGDSVMIQFIVPCYDSIYNENLTYGVVADVEGNEYKTIQIGTQEWMAQNLKTGTYNNGDPIIRVADNTQWSNLDQNQTGAWAYFDNDSATYDCPYGKLYNFYALEDPRGICPSGWHIPTDAEWNTLRDFLDPAAIGNNNIAGGMMKSVGTMYWAAPNTGATNSSGWSGLPGGYRFSNPGVFASFGSGGFWWSASSRGRSLAFDDAVLLDYNPNDKRFGLSCRCIKD